MSVDSASPGTSLRSSAGDRDALPEICDALFTACRKAGATHMFGVPGGGANLDAVGAAEANGIQFVLVHTETAGAIMAGVMGELTGAPGLCVVTRGPGAASAANGAAQALLDRQPLLLITDCVFASDRARISHQRLDHAGLFAAVAKATVTLDGRDPEAPAALVDLSLEGRPGPVHLDIDTSTDSPRPAPRPRPLSQPACALDPLESLLAGCERPVIVVGVGAAVAPPAKREKIFRSLSTLAAKSNVPVLCTYKARGFAPDSASWCAGVATGATVEAPLLHEADLILGIGLDPVEFIPSPWPYPAPVALVGTWPVDDSTFFGDRLACELVGDLPALVDDLGARLHSTWPLGSGERHGLRAEREILAAVPAAATGLTPHEVVTLAREVAPLDTTVTVDAGAHMFPAMHLWHVERPSHLLISSGLATMGFALPAAIAASLARPGQPVICFTGDGGIGMALAELETLARLDLPVVVVVFNDATLSLIAAKQKGDAHGGAAAVTYRRIDFAGLARSCGMAADRCESASAYSAALRKALSSNRPTLLDVTVDPSSYPAVLDAIRGAR